MTFGEATVVALFCFFMAVSVLATLALIFRGMSYLLTNEKIKQELKRLSSIIKEKLNIKDKNAEEEQEQTVLKEEPTIIQDNSNAYGGTLRLFDVTDDEAALVMAIVCDEMGAKPSELIFKSIKLIKE